MNISYFDDKIVLQSSKIGFFIFAALGLAAIVLGVIFWKKLSGDLLYVKQVLIALGICFFLGALLFIFYQNNIKISINQPGGKIRFSEILSGKNYDAVFSLSDFKRLDIYQTISKSSDNSGKSVSINYEANLIRNNNSPNKLCRFTSFNKAKTFADKFAQLSDIPIHFYFSPEQTIPISAGDVKNTMVVHENSPLEQWKKITPSDVSASWNAEYELPEKSSIDITGNNDATYITWSARSYFLMSILFLIIGGVFFYLLSQLVIKTHGWSTGLVIGFIIDGLFILITLFMIIYSIFGGPKLSIKNDSIKYETFLFNKRIFEQEFDYNNIRMIWNSMNTGEDNQIAIFTDDGLEAMFEIYEMKDRNPYAMMGKVFNMKNYIMNIDTRPLSYPERLYIEQILLEKIRQNQADKR